MSQPFLSVGRLQRRLSTGTYESLQFEPGVNILVGRPNTGKTKWLQTLDYLLGDPGGHPFEDAEETEGLAAKYDAASAELLIGAESLQIERRWTERNNKGKVFVDGEAMVAKDFQHYLMEKLGIPLLHFPKGNPMSGQTWPELSFRMLLRHIYRQQRFWGDIVPQQLEGERHACLLQFLGMAENLFSEDYGELTQLKLEVQKLKIRREQFGQSIDEVTSEVVSDEVIGVGVNVTTVGEAENRIGGEIESLLQQRSQLILGARDQIVSGQQRGRVQQLSEERARVLVDLEELRHRVGATSERLIEIERYNSDLSSESERMARAEDAAQLLADLRITHCPACDQSIEDKTHDPNHCFLCDQVLQEEPAIEGLGSARLQFERDRIAGEKDEANDLLNLLRREQGDANRRISTATERLRMIENELAPARQSVGALAQEEVSAIDMSLGELNERQRQLGRISAALARGQELTQRIAALEKRIETLEAQVRESVRAVDFEDMATQLEVGMNDYLTKINEYRSNVWQHSSVRVDVSRTVSSIKVGSKRWQAALGGTDSLYFLMAYQYGLLSLSNREKSHYPGISIIDVQGEFAGEAVEDKENFIVQPFVDLLRGSDYQGAQLIITGASFRGLENANRQTLNRVYTA